jgi:hypothetical protein
MSCSCTLYQLLGVSRHEKDQAVLEERALARTSQVRAYQLTHPRASSRLLNDIAHALETLLDPGKRAAYDAGLGQPPARTETRGPKPGPRKAHLVSSLVPVPRRLGNKPLLCDVTLVVRKATGNARPRTAPFARRLS